MRTSLIEIADIDRYILRNQNTADRLLMDGKLLINRNLSEKVAWQKKVYQVIQLHGRNELKAELESIHHQLFSLPKYRVFAQKVIKYFK